MQTTTMAERAKIFDNGGNQAVELPETCRFPEGVHEVLVSRQGRKIIFEPIEPAAWVNGWPPEFLATFGSWKEEIPRPPQQPIAKKKNPFG
jgi:virulence-associated protein VagC